MNSRDPRSGQGPKNRLDAGHSNAAETEFGAESAADPSKFPANSETRAQKLARIRARIEAGDYDSEEMMDKALRRMLDRWSE